MEIWSQGSRVLFLPLVCCNMPGEITQFAKQTAALQAGMESSGVLQLYSLSV